MYSRLLATHPLVTKCITSGLLFSLGDAITQKVIQKKQGFDFRRNLGLTITGTFYLGPCLHVWYSKWLPRLASRVVGSATAAGTDTASRVKLAGTGMLFDQLLFAPIFLTGFFIFNSWVKDFTMASAESGVQLAKDKMGQTMITNWKIWPAATMINLMFVPIPYRVLFANFIGLFWNMYLSFVANN